MTPNLFASELMLLCIATVAFTVFWDLMRTKDGWLRIIMMIYMTAEIIIYLGSAIYFWLSASGHTTMGIDAFRLIILPSKVIAMLFLMIWIRRNDGL